MASYNITFRGVPLTVTGHLRHAPGERFAAQFDIYTIQTLAPDTDITELLSGEAINRIGEVTKAQIARGAKES